MCLCPRTRSWRPRRCQRASCCSQSSCRRPCSGCALAAPPAKHRAAAHRQAEDLQALDRHVAGLDEHAIRRAVGPVPALSFTRRAASASVRRGLSLAPEFVSAPVAGCRWIMVPVGALAPVSWGAARSGPKNGGGRGCLQGGPYRLSSVHDRLLCPRGRPSTSELDSRDRSNASIRRCAKSTEEALGWLVRWTSDAHRASSTSRTSARASRKDVARQANCPRLPSESSSATPATALRSRQCDWPGSSLRNRAALK